MTVRKTFSLAYGPVPEGATCHVGCDYINTALIRPTVRHKRQSMTLNDFNKWEDDGIGVLGPDISDCRADAFVGFFGDEYDRVVKESQLKTAEQVTRG